MQSEKLSSTCGYKGNLISMCVFIYSLQQKQRDWDVVALNITENHFTQLNRMYDKFEFMNAVHSVHAFISEILPIWGRMQKKKKM